MKLAIGVMSGTSCDGVSFALASFTPSSFKTLSYETYDYPAPLKKKLLSASELRTPDLSKLNFELGILFAEKLAAFIKVNKTSPAEVSVIGSHGHTMWHAGQENPAHTLQLGEPSFMAEKTGIPVVSDFRPRHIAAGGQGAPLIPFFDQFFFGGKPRALQNIGGIGNVTIAGVPKPYGFDTGPGNCLIDLAVQKMTKGRQAYDTDGKIAARGKILADQVRIMLAHPYFSRKPPKSSGRELFNENFIPAGLQKAKPEDRVATLTYFTAASIQLSCKKFVKEHFREMIVSGGGALNKILMAHLKKMMPVPVLSSESFGLAAQAKEPAAFAFFALRALEGKPNCLPPGGKSCVLGKITPAGKTREPAAPPARGAAPEKKKIRNLDLKLAFRN